MKRRESWTGWATGAVALTLAAVLTLAARLGAQEAMPPRPPPGTTVARPNILWLMIEDASAHEFQCYGNAHSKTPVLNGLAARGVLFERAWASGPQCSPSRASIITGSQATTYGTDRHRSKVAIPEDHYFPLALREAGYFCTNNPKTDYNTPHDPKNIWDISSGGASYNSPRRKPGQPFYAVFNCEATHMGRVRSFDLKGRRDFAAGGLDPAKLQLPAHLPDLPEVRSDYAFHLEGIQDVDAWVDIFIKDLKARGLDEDTIIFFASDHGGVSPRGKGYVYETGLRVPLIVYVPPKFRHLSQFGSGVRSNRLVGLVDMGPTILSLAGIKPPARMQGIAFLGEHAAANREYLFGFSTNQGGHFQPARAVTDGRFKLFRSYTPHKPLSLRNGYQWGMPANLAWDNYALNGQNTKADWMLPFHPTKADRLFDLNNDPFEVIDLSADPHHRGTLETLGRVLDDQMRDTADLGLFSLAQRGRKEGLYAWTRATNYPLPQLHEAAKIAAQGDVRNVGKLTGYLKSEKPEIRFWGASGFATLGASLGGGAPSGPQRWQPPAELLHAIKDPDTSIAAEAALALCYGRRTDVGLPALLDMWSKGSSSAQSALETFALTDAGRAAMRPQIARLQKMAGNAVAEVPSPQGDDSEGGNKGSQARAILVNLREMPVNQLYGAREQAKGAAVNADRRALKPGP